MNSVTLGLLQSVEQAYAAKVKPDCQFRSSKEFWIRAKCATQEWVNVEIGCTAHAQSFRKVYYYNILCCTVLLWNKLVALGLEMWYLSCMSDIRCGKILLMVMAGVIF